VDLVAAQMVLRQTLNRQQVVQILAVAVAVVGTVLLLLGLDQQAAPVSSSSSTPYLAKPSLYSKARLSGNVLRV
jgi:hypothetical protein